MPIEITRVIDVKVSDLDDHVDGFVSSLCVVGRLPSALRAPTFDYYRTIHVS